MNRLEFALRTDHYNAMDVRAFAMVIFFAVGLCTAEINICPPELAAKIQDVFGAANNVQQGVWHRLPCPPFREDEALIGVIWRKVAEEGNTVRLITRSTSGDFPISDRYGISSGLSLLIKGVELSDEGRYQCEVIPRATLQRIGEIDIHVIGGFFPTSVSETLTTVSFQRGRRQTLPCQCAHRSPSADISVVYWSTGEGFTTDTDIIAARFSNGAVLQFQHGADYSIDADSSLVINSLNAVHDNQRFWCHVFKLDGSLSNCFDDVTTSVDGRPSVNALRASAASFYLRKGMEQILPCRSWAPGLTTCGIRWFKIGTSSQLLLNYTVSDGVIDAVKEFDLTGEFGLVFKLVEEDHAAGKYSCAADFGHRTEVLVVRVIGDTFPLDGGPATASETLTFEVDRNVTIACPAGMNTIAMGKATVIWSFGATDAQTTTVIGTLDLTAGSKTISYLGENSCFDITSEGSLLLTNCSQDGDVRYWCHVFPYNDVLHRSYVDMLINSDLHPPTSFPVIIVIVVCVCLLLSIVLILIVVIVCKWRKKQTSYSSRDPERNEYTIIEKEAPVPELDVKSLESEVKEFVMETMGRLPITPWVAWENGCYAPTDEVYTPLELFVNGSVAGISVRYRLESESETFDDGVSKPSGSAVVVQGRAGCGKTTFLYKLAFDWYNKKSDAVLCEKKLVFVLLSAVLVKAGNLGKAVLRHMLPQNTNILAASINEYCKQHPDDVAILVDGCDEKEMKSVLKIMKDNDLLKCQVVMTTRHTQLAQKTCQEHNLRQVTITGFSPHNAHKYVQKIITFEEQKSIEKTPTQTKSGKKDNQSSDRKSITTDELDESLAKADTKKGKMFEAKKERDGAKKESSGTNYDIGLIDTDDEKQSLPTDNRKTQKETVKSPEGVGQDKTTKIRCSDRKQNDSSERTQIGSVKDEPEENIFAEVSTSTRGETRANKPLIKGIDSEAGKTDDTRQKSTSNVIGKSLHSYLDSDILHSRVACLPANLTALCRLSVWTKGEAFRSEPSMGDIFFQLVKCIFDKGHYRAKHCADLQATAKGSEEEGREAKLTREQQDILVSLGRHALRMICDTCLKVPGTFPKSNVLNSSEMEKDILEAGIKAGFLCCEGAVAVKPETDTSGEDAKLLPSQPEDRKVYFVLEILQEFCAGIYMAHTTDNISTWVDTISEIDIMTSVIKLANVLMFACLPQSSSNTRSGIETYIKTSVEKAQKQVSGQLTDVVQFQKLVELCLQLNVEGQCENSGSPVIEGKKVRLVGVSSHKIRLLSCLFEQVRRYSNEYRCKVEQDVWKAYEDLTSIELFRMDGHDWVDLRPYLEDFAPGILKDADRVTYEIMARNEEAKTSKLLRERIESSDDMPKFPSDQSDVTVLHTVQTLGLQELIESQAGECYSSSSAKKLALCLPGLETLQSIVFVGTILSSHNLCEFARDLDNFPNLQKLDIRLNTQFDDNAFAAIINSLHACKNLTDLRLSLFRVTRAGFQYVREKNAEENGSSWSQLKKLYLLHGSSAETFVAFLADGLKYFHFVRHFHISETTPRKEIPVSDIEMFKKNITDQKIMTNLNDFNIGNIEELKSVSESLKLPKKTLCH